LAGVPSERIKDEPSSRPGSGLTGTTSQLPLGSTTGNFSTNLGLGEELASYIPSSLGFNISETTTKLATENGQQSFTTGSWKEGGGVKSLDVPQSRISVRQHHSILCLLSLLSYFLGGPYLLVWLLIYEITFVLMNGFTLPAFYTSKNSFFTLLALFGVPDLYRKRLGEIALILNWLITDLTIFIASVLVPVFALYLM